PGMESVVAGNYHQIIATLCKEAEVTLPKISDWKAFNEQCVDLVSEVIDKQGDKFVFFDRVIIDEGQDLMTESFIDVVDLVLKDGVYPPKSDLRKGGKWCIALDVAQAIYSENVTPDVLERLEGYMPAILKLNKYCRKTRKMAEYVYGFSGSG